MKNMVFPGVFVQESPGKKCLKVFSFQESMISDASGYTLKRRFIHIASQ